MKKIKIKFTAFLLALSIVLGAAAIPVPALAAADCAGQEVAVDVGCSGDTNPIYAYAKGIMRFLSALVGVVVVGAIIVGGIAYSSAGDDKGQIAKAIDIIRNAIIGLLLFIGMAAILNALVPGGLFG